MAALSLSSSVSSSISLSKNVHLKKNNKVSRVEKTSAFFSQKDNQNSRQSLVFDKKLIQKVSESSIALSATVATNLISIGSAQAADIVSASSEGFPFALASGGAIAALAAILSFTDPEKRRQKQVEEVGGNEKDAVRNYFNTAGFDRWRKIYGETDDVNSVQLDIRTGHAQTVDKVLNWLKGSGELKDVTVCDAGCGTGSLAIPLALEGAKVSASDISSAMVSEAQRRAEIEIEKSGKGTMPTFSALDLESMEGKYHTVACLDVLIHYPQDKAGGMISHLASLAENRLILSFAPYTPFYAILKRIGELFPGPSKATRAYLHSEEDIENALRAVGWQVKRREMTSTRFYFSRLLEAEPIKSSN